MQRWCVGYAEVDDEESALIVDALIDLKRQFAFE